MCRLLQLSWLWRSEFRFVHFNLVTQPSLRHENYGIFVVSSTSSRGERARVDERARQYFTNCLWMRDDAPACMHFPPGKTYMYSFLFRSLRSRQLSHSVWHLYIEVHTQRMHICSYQHQHTCSMSLPSPSPSPPPPPLSTHIRTRNRQIGDYVSNAFSMLHNILITKTVSFVDSWIWVKFMPTTTTKSSRLKVGWKLNTIKIKGQTNLFLCVNVWVFPCASTYIF